MKKILFILMMVLELRGDNVPEEHTLEDWTQESNAWSELEEPCRCCTFTRSHQRDIEHLNAAITVYNALLAIMPYLLKDLERVNGYEDYNVNPTKG